MPWLGQEVLNGGLSAAFATQESCTIMTDKEHNTPSTPRCLLERSTVEPLHQVESVASHLRGWKDRKCQSLALSIFPTSTLAESR